METTDSLIAKMQSDIEHLNNSFGEFKDDNRFYHEEQNNATRTVRLKFSYEV